MRHIVWILLLCTLTVSAQKSDRDYIRSGNRLYKDSLYAKAEVDYRKAIELNSHSSHAYFNLGNALLRQQKAKEAMEAYETAVKVENNKMRQGHIYHNMGVILQSQKQFAPAIECYKNALRRNPHDDESRYNLVLCQHQLKNSPQDNSNDQNQQQEGQDQQQKDQQQKNKEQQQKEDKQQQQQSQSSKPKEEEGAMSKENIEQMLQAAMQDEKATQEKVKKAMTQPRRKRLQKEW